MDFDCDNFQDLLINVLSSGDEGLGSLPTNLTSASSLTVYNTVQTVYNNVQDKASEDPLAAKSKQKTKLGESTGEMIKDDPSALHGDYDGGNDDKDMFYFPEMGDLPTFDLPDALELPNIATDLQVDFFKYFSYFKNYFSFK